MALSFLPSFRNSHTIDRGWDFPRIFVLAVRPRKKPDSDDAVYFVVESEEKIVHHDNEVREAFLTISYSLITNEHVMTGGKFLSSYHRRYQEPNGMVSLTSHGYGHGAVFLELPGLSGNRVGSFLMHLVVRWLKQWPLASVHPIELLPEDAQGTNGPRRNAFYQNIGLEFDGLENQVERVYSKPTTVEKLIVTDSWKQNIEVVSMADFLIQNTTQVKSLRFELENQKDIAESQYQRANRLEKQSPLHWLKLLWWKIP